jgi:hypothetical protein
VPQTLAGRGLQSAGISGIANLTYIVSMAHSQIVAPKTVLTHHLSGGTPFGSSMNPTNTGLPSCHLSTSSGTVLPSTARPARSGRFASAREGPPMTTTSSSGSAVSNAKALEELDVVDVILFFVWRPGTECYRAHCQRCPIHHPSRNSDPGSNCWGEVDSCSG